MSLVESVSSSAKDLLLASENIKHLSEQVRFLSSEVGAIDRRLVRVETFMEIARQPSPESARTLQVSTPRKRPGRKS